MKIGKTIIETITALKQAGYYRVSLHELAWHTKLPAGRIMSNLRSNGHTITTQDDEYYIQLGDQK